MPMLASAAWQISRVLALSKPLAPKMRNASRSRRSRVPVSGREGEASGEAPTDGTDGPDKGTVEGAEEDMAADSSEINQSID